MLGDYFYLFDLSNGIPSAFGALDHLEAPTITSNETTNGSALTRALFWLAQLLTNGNCCAVAKNNENAKAAIVM